jgi:secreted trypsin-like serine protease
VQEFVPELFRPEIICAGNVALKESACKGDSGGPLMIFDTRDFRYVQVGIVAGGINPENCGDRDFPTIYTRLDDPEVFDFVKSKVEEKGKFVLNLLLIKVSKFSGSK